MRDGLWKKIRRIVAESRYIFRQLPSLVRTGKKVLFWLVLCEIMMVLQVYPAKYTFDAIGNQSVPAFAQARMNLEQYGYLLAVAVVLVYGLGVYFHKKRSIWQNDFELKVKALLWTEAHYKELQLSTDWHLAHGTGEKETIIAKNAYRTSELFRQLLWYASPVALRIIINSAVMLWFGWGYGILSLVTFVAYATIIKRAQKHVRPLMLEFHNDEKAVERFGSELTSSWRVIRSFGLEVWFSDRNYKKLLWFWKRDRDRHKVWRYFVDQPDMMLAFSRGVLVILAFRQGLANPNEVGSAVLAYMLMERVYSNYFRLGDFQRALQMGMESLRELTDIMLTEPTVKQVGEAIWPEKVEGRVEFRDVCFRYEDGVMAVSNVSFAAEPNQIIAFMGMTGSGKTTLLSLLQREHDPCGGAILIDGVDLKRLDFLRYRQDMIGVVQQHSALFDDTIERNISIARRYKATLEEVRHASRQAYAEEFIDKLPNGYKTMIGENGVRLSGGQRQRLAIARALLRRPKILILDEPTSALDPDSQRQVQRAIDELIARRESTIFVIAHRFSTILKADKVVVMDNGMVEDIGTHEELAKRNGRYKHFRDLEMGGALA